MAKRKATITVDGDKMAAARMLVGAPSMSAVIDIALDRLIRAERLRRDVEAYTSIPMTDDELVLACLPVRLELGDEDVDYDAFYGSGR